MGRLLVFALPLLVWWGLAFAQDLLPVPALSARVIDQTGTLTAQEQQTLESKLAQFETEAGTQIVVLMVPTTAPEDIAAYAHRVADTWKIGRREVGDGLLVLVAKNDRRMRIEVAKTLEGAVPDLAAYQIIDQTLVPAFRTNDYAGGLNAALDRLMQRVRGEALPPPSRPTPGFQLEDTAVFLFFAVLVFGQMLVQLFGRRVGALSTGAVAGGLAWWVTASLAIAAVAGIAALVIVGVFGLGSAMRGLRGRPRSGGPFGSDWGGYHGGWGGGDRSGGNGGFSSGGGGDFGGGGASGSW